MMGLDITAYRKLKPVENPELDEDGCPVNYCTEWLPGASMEWSESVWPGRGEGVDWKTVYTYEEEFDFRAGSYSGYNRWRSLLKQFANQQTDNADLFSELINFADNEGVIGSVVSKKLAYFFADYEELAKKYAETIKNELGWWLESYYEWKKAFKMASDGGAVYFH